MTPLLIRVTLCYSSFCYIIAQCNFLNVGTAITNYFSLIKLLFILLKFPVVIVLSSSSLLMSLKSVSACNPLSQLAVIVMEKW